MTKPAGSLTPLIFEPVGRKGGMHYYNTGLCKGLISAGLSPILCSSRDPLAMDLPDVRLSKLGERVLDPGAKILKAFKLMLAAGRVAKMYKAGEIQLVHIHLFGFTPHYLAAVSRIRRSGAPVIATIHDVSDLGAGPTSERVAKGILKRLSGVIVHNEFSLKSLKGAFPDIKVPIETIPHGHYIDFYEPTTGAGSPNTVLFFGQIKPTKGLDLLMNAFGRIAGENPNVRLVVAGKPWRETEENVREWARSFGIEKQTEFHLRYINDDEVPEFFSNAGIVVLPYREIYQSGVLMLCMSMRKATLTSDLAPFVETIGDSNGGRTFKSGDAKDLAKSLKDMLGNRRAQEIYGDRALEYAKEKCNWDEIGLKIKRFYAMVARN